LNEGLNDSLDADEPVIKPSLKRYVSACAADSRFNPLSLILGIAAQLANAWKKKMQLRS
jgi:hypothetical protein